MLRTWLMLALALAFLVAVALLRTPTPDLPSVTPAVDENAPTAVAAVSGAVEPSRLDASPTVAAPTAAPTAAPAAMDRGTLRILVRSEANVPLANCSVEIANAKGKTAADGRVALTLPAGHHLTKVRPRPPFEPLDGLLLVDAGREREVVLTLHANAATSFWCRLVAAADNAPRANVDIQSMPGLSIAARTDRDGLAQLAMRADVKWFEPQPNSRQAIRRIVWEPGHDVAASAMVVPIEPGATLRVLCDGTVRASRLVARLMPWQVQWPVTAKGPSTLCEPAATAALDGSLTLTNLPVHESMRVQFLRERDVLFEAEWLLEPGMNERRVTLSELATVRGHLVDAHGAPLVSLTVVATTAVDDLLTATVRRSEPVLGDGSFTIHGLFAGDWRITLAGAKAPPLPPTGITVVGSTTTTLELRALLTGAIRGRTLLDGERPAADVAISAAIDGKWIAGTRSTADGTFTLPAVPTGNCMLDVESFHDTLGLPRPVPAAAGDTDVVLRLVPTFGSVHGTIAGANDVWYMARLRGRAEAIGSRCDLDGSLRCDGLQAGTWDFTFQDRGDNVYAAVDVAVLPGQVTALAVPTLAPGATLLPRSKTADEFVVLRGNAVLGADNLRPGEPGNAAVPPGDCVLVFRRAGAEIARRPLQVQAGERRTVEVP